MRFPDLRAVAALLMAMAVPLASAAGPEDVRNEFLAQQKARHAALSAQRAPELFVDRTAEIGIDVTHVNGAAGELLLPEVIGSGGVEASAERGHGGEDVAPMER